MKKLSEMKIAKKAILSDSETAFMGGTQVGSGTSYIGPGNPASIATYVDGIYFGEDQPIGNLFGDSWNIEASYGSSKVGSGRLEVAK